MQEKLFFFVLFNLILNISLFSQELGNPLIKNYSPEEYISHSQNWAIVQDQRGVMYFGNTECIVEYDGTFWNKIYSSNKTIIRSFAIGSNGVIYVGAVGDFGYLAADSLGNTVFYTLTDRLDSLDKEFNDVWETVSTNSGVFFRSMKKIFRYKPETDELKVWSSENELFFNPSFSMPSLVDNYIFRVGYQYHKMVNDQIVPLQKSDLLSDYFVYKLIPFNNSKFLCITYNQIFTFDISKINEEPASIFSEKLTQIFTDAALYMGTKIDEEKFAITSRNKGAFIINSQGEIEENITSTSNLQDNFVWTSFLDKNKLLWLGLNNGFSSVEINSPFRIWDKNTEFAESVNDIIRFNNKIYLATMNGFFYIKQSENLFEPNQIIEIEGTQNELWKFCEYFDQIQQKERLFVAGSKSLNEIINNEVIELEEYSYLYNLANCKINRKIIYLVMMNNFTAIELNNNKITEVGNISLPGVLKYFAQDNDGTIWVGTTYNGIYKLENDKDKQIDTSKYYKSGIFEKTKVTLYDTLNGFPNLQRIAPYIIDNQMYFGTTQGLYYYNKNIIEKDTVLSVKFENSDMQIDNIKEDSNGNLYFLSNLSIYRLLKQKNQDYKIDSTVYKRIEKYIKSVIYIENSDNIWFAGVSSLIHFNPNIISDTNQIFNTLIRKVSITGDSIIFFGNYYSNKLAEGYNFSLEQPENLIPILDYKNNSIIFHYSSPYFIAQEDILYSYLLDGYEDKWSEWTSETKKEYTNLHEGNYIFKVKAKSIYENQSTIAEYKFEILPPWYRTILSIILYFVLGILIIVFSVKFYLRRLIKEKIKLEEIVAERTKEISLKNSELENQKEEILAQAEELELINKELEKLSIVARETDNAIVITDKFGNFEWINNGFTRLYGYNFNEFISKASNLLQATSNKNLKKLFDICLTEKKSVSYESFMITKSDEKIWAQSTITPILNQDNEIYKLIIIDTDISKLKRAEQEILQKNEEISAQKEALEQQNEEISAQRDELEDRAIGFNFFIKF